PTDGSSCHSSVPDPPIRSTASMTSISQFEPGNCTTPTVTTSDRPNRDRRVLDDRIGEEALAHVHHLGARRVLVGRVQPERDALADANTLHAVETERRQRTLDGGALG